MGGIYAFAGVVPVVDPASYVHPRATLIGDVIIAAHCFVGPGAVLRGDLGRIEMRAGSNLQDNCVLHTYPGCDVIIEEDGHIGHSAVLHGCIIKRNALIGISAIVLDDAVVGEEAMVAAAAMVPAKFEVPPRTLVAGIPARVKRSLSAEDIAGKTHGTRIYQDLAARALRVVAPCEPLRAPEPQRRRVPAPFTAA
jgi:phenylacetic acid degradation protein